MNVQELIERLESIEDKTLMVCLEDWNENYCLAHELNSVSETNCLHIKNNQMSETHNKYVSLDCL